MLGEGEICKLLCCKELILVLLCYRQPASDALGATARLFSLCTLACTSVCVCACVRVYMHVYVGVPDSSRPYMGSSGTLGLLVKSDDVTGCNQGGSDVLYTAKPPV